MTDDHARIEQLEAQLAALRAEIRRPRRRPARRFLPLILAALLVALVPLTTLAANPFTDLVPGSVHNANIDAIYNAGITTGCVPNAQYCPTDNVTRQEMASFLARTAGLEANPPVANAKTLQGYAPNGLARVAKASFSGGVPITGNEKIYGDVLTIAAPAPGYVLVTAEVNMIYASGATATGTTRIRHVQKDAKSQSVITSMSATVPWVNAAMTSVFLVDAGTQTFQISIDNNSGGFQAAQHNMTGIYIPFDASGTAPTAP